MLTVLKEVDQEQTGKRGGHGGESVRVTFDPDKSKFIALLAA